MTTLMQRITGPKSDADAAFAELVATYSPRLEGYAFRFVNDWQAAEDVAQHVLMTVWKHRANYREEHEFDGWIYAICRNRCLDVLRRRTCDVLAHCTDSSDPFAAVCVETVESPDCLSLDAIESVLAELPAEQRETLEMYCQGFSLPQIAEMKCIPLPTAKSRLRLAKAKIRERIAA